MGYTLPAAKGKGSSSMTKTREFGRAAVLFSGGTDSTLCAVRTLDMADSIELLTFQPGFVFFLDNARKGAAALIDRYGPERVRHSMIAIDETNRRFLFDRWRELLGRYGFHMTSLVCLGCRLSMHAAALAHCLEHGIPLLTDGSIRVQADIPEQMEEVLRRNRAHYAERYGITCRSPIYDEPRSDRKLWDMGLAPRKNLKGQFIFFETQATCPFGVTADVYARIFYGKAMGDERLRNSMAFLDESHPLVERAVAERLEAVGLDLDRAVADLKAGKTPPPVDEEEGELPPAGPDPLPVVALRFLGRYLVAVCMIPLGVLLGVGGLIQRWWQRRSRS